MFENGKDMRVSGGGVGVITHLVIPLRRFFFFPSSDQKIVSFSLAQYRLMLIFY